ncbi:MAG: PHP domain-containing protein [Lachnospiraceae bacterium]|nr:PHP domain-containing protein [Lachnospiraceae bacterium]
MSEAGQCVIDLHVHSDVSDGTYTPTELVEYALKKGLTAMALTDHDTVDGVEEALRCAEGTGLELIPGVELSAEYLGRDIHILGLFLDYQSEKFRAYLQEFKNTRDMRNVKMAECLTAHKMPVTVEELKAEYGDAVLTRAHFAKFLKKKGFVNSYDEAFMRFLGDDKPCYVPRERITPEGAVKLIHEAKGIAVLAHPLLYHLGMDELEVLVKQLKSYGLDAIEAIYSMNKGRDERRMKELAKKYGLLITGGSDFHGATKPHIDLGTGQGNLLIPAALLKEIKKILK